MKMMVKFKEDELWPMMIPVEDNKPMSFDHVIEMDKKEYEQYKGLLNKFLELNKKIEELCYPP